MKQLRNQSYEFGPFFLDAQERLLQRDGAAVSLTPKAFDLLLALLERQGRLVEKEELFQAVWPDTIVEESNLSSNIAILRKALGEGENGLKFIETVPKRGYRFVAEIRETGYAKDEESLGRKVTATDVPTAITVTPPAPSKRVKWLALLAALGIFIGLTTWWITSHSLQPIPLKITPLTAYPGIESYPSFSPDGNQIAFTWTGDDPDEISHVYVKQIGNEALHQLTNSTFSDFASSWSPDGQYIAFVRRVTPIDRELYVIPSLGGTERKLSDHVFNNVYRISWSPDSKWIALDGRESDKEPGCIYQVVLKTGETKKLTAPTSENWGDQAPAISPDGKTVAFSRTISIYQADLYLLALASGETKRLTFDNFSIYSPNWTPDGREIVFASNHGIDGFTQSAKLWRIAANGGTPQAVEAGSGRYWERLNLSRQGNKLAWGESVNDPNIWRLDLNNPSNTTPRKFIFSTQIDESPQYSPDGKKIAFVSSRSNSDEIYVCDSEGGHLLQVTKGERAASPRWSPDGRQIVYDNITNDGGADIFIISAEGGEPRRLTNDPAEDIVPSWSHDGQWIYFCSNRSGTQQIWKMPASGGRARQVTQHGGFDNVESPDGRFLYYAKGRLLSGIWRIPVTGGEETLVLDQYRAGYWRYWAVTEKGIYFAYQRPKERMIEFYDFSSGAIKPVATLEKRLLLESPGLTVSPDGRTLLWTQIDQWGSDLMLMDNFR